MKNNRIIKICLLLLVSIISFPFIINFTYEVIMYNFPHSFTIKGPDTWINFFGGFLGSSVALVGIYWQLEESKKEKKIELINNTQASYILLEAELSVINTSKSLFDKVISQIEEVNILKEELQSIEDPKLKNEIEKIEKKIEKIEDIIKSSINFIKSYKLNKTNILYDYINQSLPLEKAILLYDVSLLTIYTNQKDSFDHNFETLLTFKNSLYPTITKTLNKVTSNRERFEKRYSKDLYSKQNL